MRFNVRRILHGANKIRHAGTNFYNRMNSQIKKINRANDLQQSLRAQRPFNQSEFQSIAQPTTKLELLLATERATDEARAMCQSKGAFAVTPTLIAALNADVVASALALDARFGSPAKRWRCTAELALYSVRTLFDRIVVAIGIPIFAFAFLCGIVVLGLVLLLGATLELSIPLTVLLGFAFGTGAGLGSAAFAVTISVEDAIKGRTAIRHFRAELAVEESRHRALLNQLTSLNELVILRKSYDAQAAVAADWRRQYESMHNRLSMISWRALRGVDFEQFLMEVLQHHGFAVSTTKTTGDQGVDLIASYSVMRLAIQVKGYHNSVGNDAVQQAHAGKDHYRCTHSVVITNSVFTKSARELAQSVNCYLIDETLIPDLIAGRIFSAARSTNSGSSAGQKP